MPASTEKQETMDAEDIVSAESSLSLDNESMYNADTSNAVVAETHDGKDASTSKAPSRLIITKMVLENFKSYAGVKEIGPFHKCFSAVVGPNGSGKSNVIDAMLFVFGKRAKKLRLNKVSELIHSSDAFKDSPLDYARVSVHFVDIIDTGDGDEDYEVIPGTEVVVTRIARRDNSSTYKLDGRNSSFKDVALYLESKGIDLNNNRFLILQGEVELISMMAPKGKTEDDEGLLEYLEDIIGSNKFVEQANEAAAHVESLNEQRQERLNRVKALEKEKESLEGAKLEAEALLGKERDIRRKKNILIQINAMEATCDLEESSRKCNELKESLKDTRSQIAEKEKDFSSNDAVLVHETEKHEKLLKALKNAKEEFSYFERKDIQLREERKHVKATMKKLDAKIKAEDAKNKDFTAKAKEANENISVLSQKISEINEQKSKESERLEQLYDNIRDVTKELRQKLEDKTQELAPLHQERATYQAALDTAVTEAKLLEDSSKRSKELLISAENELSSLDEKQSLLRLELAKTENELAVSKKRITEAQKEAGVLLSQEKVLATRSAELTVRLPLYLLYSLGIVISNLISPFLNHDLHQAKAEEAKTAFQVSSASSEAVNGILAQAKKGGALATAGILGRLGDLGSISSEYDIAVSTACGMLDHIVVETTQGAQQCLEYLRINGLGRANFIPLEKMKKGAHDRAVETPENAQRLFDLIRMRNYNLASAFYLAVGNTLVAPDLETATRWAYEYGKRWRVVTTDGKLIETSGTMAGGGTSVKRGGMRLTVSHIQLLLFMKFLLTHFLIFSFPLHSQINTIHPCNQNSAQVAMNATLNEGEVTEDDIKKLETLAKQALEDLQICRQKRTEIQDEIRSLEKHIKSLSINVPKLSMQASGCDTTREELTKRLPELRKQSILSESDMSKLASLLQTVEKCKGDMASCSTEASKLEEEVAKLQKSILEAGGAKLLEQQNKCERIASSLEATSKTLSAEKVTATSAQKNAEKAAKLKLSYQDELQSIKHKFEDLEREIKILEDQALVALNAFDDAKEEEETQRKLVEDAAKESDTQKKLFSKLLENELEIVGQIDTLEKQIREAEKRLNHWQSELQKLYAAEVEDEEADVSDDESNDDAREQRPKEELEGENDCSRHKTFPTYSRDALQQYQKDEVKEAIRVLEQERDSLAKNSNMGAIAEYRKKEQDYLAR